MWPAADPAVAELDAVGHGVPHVIQEHHQEGHAHLGCILTHVRFSLLTPYGNFAKTKATYIQKVPKYLVFGW